MQSDDGGLRESQPGRSTSPTILRVPMQLGEDPSRRTLVDPREVAADKSARAEVFGITDVGLVRERNEDQFLVAELERSLLVEQSSMPGQNGKHITHNPQGRLLMVADGMGGHAGGDIASAVVVDAMAHYAFALMPWVLGGARATRKELVGAIEEGIRAAQDRMRRIAERQKLDTSMGTTLTLAYVTWPDVWIMHVGDSRAYLLRKKDLTRVTRDHTVAQALVDRKALTEEEAARSKYNHILVNVVGGGSDELHVECHHFTLLERDTLLLCTDGLTAHVDDDAITEHLLAGKSVEQTARDLVEAAKDGGGSDNVTVVIAKF